MALPIAGMVLWVWFGRDKRDRSRICLAGLALVVAAFFFVAYPVVASYRNDMTAFKHTLGADPDNWRALAHVGEAECAEGSLDDGIDKLRRSREVLPRDATDAKLAYALMSRGRAEDWDEILNVCAPLASDPDPVRLDPRGQALEALGTAELKKRRWADAINHLVLSVRAPSRHYSPSDAILKLAYALHNGGRRDEALKMFEWIRDRSGREDLARRSREALFALELSPRGMLFW
jgi:tetratricopeptide (TPR) repeat protein